MARPSEFLNILRELGLRIQQARISAGVTQEQAASDSGIDYKRWQRLEEGSVNPTVKTLFRVSAAIGVPFWELLAPLPRRRPHASGQMPRVTPSSRISGEMPRARESRPPASRKPKSRAE